MTFTPSDLVVIIPMLGRAHTVAPLLDSLTATTSGATALFMCTEGDDAVISEVRARGAALRIAPKRACGDYAAKINEGYRATTQPLIFLGACDIRFHSGWFEAAIAPLSDPAVGVVGTRDMCNPRTEAEHSTHSLVTRTYADRGTIDRPREILHEGYVHEFVDDELVGTARSRGAYAHAADAVVEHLHPMVRKAPMDAMYRQQQRRMRASRALFEKRRALWT